jgi:hypothetical protein
MPTSLPAALLNFFVVMKPQSGGALAIRRLHVDNEVQQQLSEKFATMSEWWFGRDVQKKPYAATYEPTAGQVTSLRNFTIPDIYLRAAGSAQDIEPFTFPVPDNWHLRAIVGIDRRNPAKESRFLFQACDQRQVLGYKFVIFQDRNVFRRLDSRGLSIADGLHAVIDQEELLFSSYFQAKKFLPLDHLYREASNEQVRVLLGHAKLKLPEGATADGLMEHLTIPARKKIAAVLDSGILDADDVTADKIKAYAKKYCGMDMVLRTRGNRRQIEIPSEREQFLEFIRCLDEEFYTSELTQRRCETNSYRALEPGEGG